MEHSNLWFEQSPQKLSPVTGLPRETDVVIVGGGLAGLTTLLFLLTNTKLNVVLLEEGHIGCRASGRDIGNLDVLSSQMMPFLDEPETIKYIRIINESNKAFIKLLADNNIDCDFHKTGGIYVANDTANADNLTKAYGYLSKDLNDVLWPRLLEKDEVSQYMNSTQFKSGIFLPGEGLLNPYKLTLELAKKCEEIRSSIISPCSVESVTQTTSGLNVHVRNRGIISTKKIVYCTGIHTTRFVPGLNKKWYLFKQHIIATNPINPTMLQLLPRCAINFFGVKMRLFKDRMFMQGPGVLVSDKYYDTDINIRGCDSLRRILKLAYPLLEEVGISHAWSKLSAATHDDRPLIGEIPNRPNEFINAGFGPYNLNNLSLGGFYIKEMIMGTEISPQIKNMFDMGRI